VVMPGSEAVSWTVLDDGGEPIAPIEAYLSHLWAIERSPRTVRGYAIGLKLWFEFLAGAGESWDGAGLDDLARFVAWLRAPKAGTVVVEAGNAGRKPATVNQYLAAVFGFYDYLARTGVHLAEDLMTWRRAGRRGYIPFLYHATKGNPIPVRPVKLAVPHQRPKTLAEKDILAIIEACEHLRDRFLFALLAHTGLRVGQALGLRHADVLSRSRELRIVPRADNTNGARAKIPDVEVIPVSAGLIRLYSEYMHAEYGEVDSDYVFVNLWAEPYGWPLTYNSVNQLVRRLRARTGVDFNVHMLRHSAATEMIRAGVPIEVAARLLTHRSSVTTSQIYVHLLPADLRAELARAGMWTDTGPDPDSERDDPWDEGDREDGQL
jgi:integrase/recombinase XerD